MTPAKGNWSRELASLRLDDESPRSRRWAWVVIALLVFIVAAGTIFSWGRGVFAATEVETTTPRVETSGGAPSGAPLLTASGYVVARRKAVVSAKIQGRLADLRVDEGARVREGEIIARLESQDYDAQVRRASVDVQNLRKIDKRDSQEIVVLDGMNLQVPDGEFVALMGPSGPGKTTLLNCIAGIDRPTSGTVTVAGSDVTSLSEGALAKWRSRHV